MVAGEEPGLARERGRAVGEQDLRLADPARIEEQLAGRRVARRVLGPEGDVAAAERDPARFAAPARVDDPALQRQQAPERGHRRRRELLLELRDEAVVP